MVTTTTVESIIVAEEEQVSQQPEVGVDGNQLVRRKRNKKGKERLSQGESGVNAAEEQPLGDLPFVVL